MIEVFDQRLLESQHIKMKEERLLDEEVEETNDIKMLRKKKMSDLAEQTRVYSSLILKLHADINNYEQSMKVSSNITLPDLENEKKTCRRKS